MDMITEIALASGLAWASGIRLYAVVFLAGILQRFGVVALPGDLSYLAHEWVLYSSGGLLLCEFLADKIPAFDSLWDGLNTFIRIPGGTALAIAVFGDQGPALQIAAGLIGGSIVTGTHLTKAGARAAINHSPEPFSNWFASLAEDSLVLGGLWLAWQHPYLFLGLLLIFMLFVIWLLPKLWRLLRATLGRLAGLLRGGGIAPAGGDPTPP